LVLLAVVVVGLVVAGVFRGCQEQPEEDHGTMILKGGVER